MIAILVIREHVHITGRGDVLITSFKDNGIEPDQKSEFVDYLMDLTVKFDHKMRTIKSVELTRGAMGGAMYKDVFGIVLGGEASEVGVSVYYNHELPNVS